MLVCVACNIYVLPTLITLSTQQQKINNNDIHSFSQSVITIKKNDYAMASI